MREMDFEETSDVFMEMSGRAYRAGDRELQAALHLLRDAAYDARKTPSRAGIFAHAAEGLVEHRIERKARAVIGYPEAG